MTTVPPWAWVMLALFLGSFVGLVVVLWRLEAEGLDDDRSGNWRH